MLKHLSGPDTRPSRVVIFGRSGFLGSYLLAALNKSGIPAVALGRPEIDLTAPASVDAVLEIVRADDTVVILSALTPDKGRDFRTLMKNLRMAEHLCEAFNRRSCAHVVYVSSDAVYDGQQTPIDEHSSRQPTDLYALMHSGREMMLQSVVTARSIPMCILRPVAVFGVGDTHNSYGPNRFVREALASRTITLFGTGGDERSHLYVDDAARLISRCVQRVSTGSLNLAHPESLTFLQIAEMVRAHLPFVTEVKFTGGTAPAPSRRPFDVRQLCDAFPDFEFTPTYEALRVFVSAKVGSPVSRR